MVTTARQNAPEKTGDLKKGLHYQVRDVGPVVELRLVGDEPYTKFQEFGTIHIPAKFFMTNAFMKTRGARWRTEQTGWPVGMMQPAIGQVSAASLVAKALDPTVFDETASDTTALHHESPWAKFWQPHRDNQDWADDWDFTADPVTRRLRVWVEVAGFASLDSTPGRSPHLPCILVRSTPVGEYDADAGYIPIRRQVVDIRVYESWNVKDMRTIPTIIQNMNDIQSDMVARLRMSAADGVEYKGAWLKSIEQLTGPALGVDEDTDYRYLESSWRVTIGENVPDP